MKKQKNAKFYSTCFMLLFSFNALANVEVKSSLEKILSDEIANELLKNGKIEKSSYIKEYTPHLFLDSELGREVPNYWKLSGKTQEPVFYFEGLYLTKKTPSTNPGKNIQEVSKNVRSISTLEGVEYYSNSRKKMRILYEESFAVNNPNERMRISDPIEKNADNQVIYALQRDSTFGRFLYKYSYKQKKNEMLINITNIDNLTLAGIKIIKPENMVSSIIVYDLGDYFVTYTLIEVDVISVSVIENKMKKSFAARAEALFAWLSSVFDKIDKMNSTELSE